MTFPYQTTKIVDLVTVLIGFITRTCWALAGKPKMLLRQGVQIPTGPIPEDLNDS